MSTEAKTKAFFTIEDLIERWDVSKSTIYREIDRGKLTKTLIGGSVRFSRKEVERYEQEN